MEEKNDALSVEIRRNRGLLLTTANGILTFGIWSILKGIGITVTDLDNLTGDVIEAAGNDKVLGIGIFVFFLIIAILIDLWFRLLVWKKAKKEASGEGRSNLLIIVTVLMIIGSIVSIGFSAYSIVKLKKDFFQSLVSIVVDLTSGVLMIELLTAVFILRRLMPSGSDPQSEEEA